MCYHRVDVGAVYFRSQIEQFEAHMRSGAMSSGGGGGGTASVNMTRDVQELRDRVTRLEQSNSVKDSLISELKIQLRNHEMVIRLQGPNSSSRPCALLRLLIAVCLHVEKVHVHLHVCACVTYHVVHLYTTDEL